MGIHFFLGHTAYCKEGNDNRERGTCVEEDFCLRTIYSVISAIPTYFKLSQLIHDGLTTPYNPPTIRPIQRPNSPLLSPHSAPAPHLRPTQRPPPPLGPNSATFSSNTAYGPLVSRVPRLSLDPTGRKVGEKVLVAGVEEMRSKSKLATASSSDEDTMKPCLLHNQEKGLLTISKK